MQNSLWEEGEVMSEITKNNTEKSWFAEALLCIVVMVSISVVGAAIYEWYFPDPPVPSNDGSDYLDERIREESDHFFNDLVNRGRSGIEQTPAAN